MALTMQPVEGQSRARVTEQVLGASSSASMKLGKGDVSFDSGGRGVQGRRGCGLI